MNDCDSQKLCICMKNNYQHGAVGTGKTKVTNVNYAFYANGVALFDLFLCLDGSQPS